MWDASSFLRNHAALKNQQLWVISIASSIRSIGFGSSWPFMAIFFNRQLGISTILVGFIFTILALISTAYSFVGGSLSDSIGRKKVILIGSGLGIVIFALISMAIIREMPAVIIAELFVFSSVSGSLVFPSASALVADISKPEHRMESYSIYRIMANLGWAIGPFVGSFIVGFGMQFIFLLLVIVGLVQFTIVAIFLKEPVHEKIKRPLISFSYDRYLVAFSMGTFFITLLWAQFSVTLPLFAVKVGGLKEQELGYLYAVNGFVVVFGQYPMTYVLRRVNDVYVFILGSAFYVAGYLLVGFMHSFLELYFDMVIITVGENLTTPGMNSVVSKISPAGKTGAYMGFMGMINQFGRAMAPSIGPVFLSFFDYYGPYTWTALSTFGMASIAIMFMFLAMKGNPISRITSTRSLEECND